MSNRDLFKTVFVNKITAGGSKKTLNLISLTKFKTRIDLKIMSLHSFRKNLLKIINSNFLSLYISKKQIILS